MVLSRSTIQIMISLAAHLINEITVALAVVDEKSVRDKYPDAAARIGV
jgi:hypothetical protein